MAPLPWKVVAKDAVFDALGNFVCQFRDAEAAATVVRAVNGRDRLRGFALALAAEIDGAMTPEELCEVVKRHALKWAGEGGV